MIQQDNSSKNYRLSNKALGIKERSEGKYNSDYFIKDIYDYYCQHSNNVIPFNVFKTICEEYNYRYIFKSILNGKYVKLGGKLGDFLIVSKTIVPRLDKNGNLFTGHLGVDYKATRELWLNNTAAKEAKKFIYHTNDHSDRKRAVFYWDKRTSNVINQSVYDFLLARDNKRELSAKMKDPNNVINYVELNWKKTC